MEVKYEKYHEYKIIWDYFIFDENDIDLHKIKKCFILYYNEFNINQSDLNKVTQKFKDLLIFIQENDYSKSAFPSLKNSLTTFLNTLLLEDNKYLNYYLIMLLLSKKNILKNSVKNYYLNIIRNNYFGISPKFGYVITREVMASEEYGKFTDSLAEWYTKVEMIIFFITLLSQFFGVILDFDEKKYSLENNFDFSIKTFAKKNFLKLASFLFKKTNLNIKMGPVNYQKIFLILISSFSCGISLKDIFLGGDIRQLTFVAGGLFVNFFLGKIATKIESYSGFIEFTRLEEIIHLLNKKVEKIHKKVYELLKLVILTKVDYNYSIQKNDIYSKILPHSEIYPNIEDKIEELFTLVNKYFQGVDALDDESEKKLIEETLFRFEEESIYNSTINEEWSVINICR